MTELSMDFLGGRGCQGIACKNRVTLQEQVTVVME
jgi:hypothetical protein